MKITLVYIAVTHGQKTEEYAARFSASYSEFPPGVPHDTVVVTNGGPLPYSISLLFSALKPKFYPRVNDPGWDISAYIELARGFCKDSQMMLCCGESIYFHQEGWLKRFVEAWEKIGPGMYGSLSSNLIRAHLNTTGFCCPPLVLSEYKNPVASRADRYEFEHGNQSLWRRVARRGMPVRLVTWDGEYEPHAWRCPPGILWRGNQKNCLMWCQHTDRYVTMDADTKARWSKNADRPFK